MVEAHQNWAFATRASSNAPSTRAADDLPGPCIDVDKADPPVPDEFEPIGARGRIIGWTEIFAAPHLGQNALFDFAQRQNPAGLHLLARFALIAAALILRLRGQRDRKRPRLNSSHLF